MSYKKIPDTTFRKKTMMLSREPKIQGVRDLDVHDIFTCYNNAQYADFKREQTL
jgi:hypothetical protein